MEDHYLICNWSPRGESIVKELRKEDSPARKQEIIILTDQRIDESQYQKIPEFSYKVTFFGGNMFKKEILKNLGAPEARTIIILKDEEVQDPDGKSVQIALVLKGLLSGSGKQQWPRLVVEVDNHRKIPLVKQAYHAGLVQPICGEDYAVGLIAQTAIYPKLAEVYSELLYYGPETNEIYMLEWEELSTEIQDQVKNGASFKELLAFLYTNSRPSNPVLLLGYVRKDRIVINPILHGGNEILHDGDAIIIMCDEKPTKKELVV